MHTSRILITGLIAFTFTSTALRAQLGDTTVSGKLSTTPTSPGVVFGGTASGTVSPDVGGAGKRMFWYPGKAAIRAGEATGTHWDNANIGIYSTAFGSSTLASGQYSTAMGMSSSATGNWGSTALGYGTTASGVYGSTAIGWNARATQVTAVAIGRDATAGGANSLATGFYTQATGSASTAMGSYSIASGQESTAMGFYTIATAHRSMVVGQYNASPVPNANPTAWVATDPIFVIGNGDGVSTIPTVKNRNAVVVYKNGNADLNGDVKVKGVIRTTVEAGDIRMFEQ